MPEKKDSISIFFPFLNDWGTIGSLIALAISTVRQLADDWEVIIVNDGSDTKNREALGVIVGIINRKQKASKTPRMVALSDPPAGGESNGVEEFRRIRIIDHKQNKGYGGSLRSGFAAATKDLIFYTDGDAQYDPRELVKLFEAMKSGIDMVNGFKIKRADPWHRIIAGRIYHHLVKLAFRLPIRDTDCDFRLVRREVFKRVRLFENTGTICVELVKKVDHFGFKIAEVPVHHFWRTSGKSQFFNFKRLFATGINLVNLWWKLMVKKEYCS